MFRRAILNYSISRTVLFNTVLFIGLAIYPASEGLAQHCQDYWTPEYKCAMGCGPCGDSGNNQSSQYSGPSQAQIQAQIAAQQAAIAQRQREQAAAVAQRQRDAAATAENNRGLDAWNKGDWATAAAEFQRALRNDPNSQNIRDNLADANQKLKEQQNNKTAINNMQQIVQNLAQNLNTSTVSSGGLDFDGNNSGANPNGGGLEFGDPMVVDARNVPSGLPKSVDHAIASGYSGAPPGVSDRVRKGFQAITTHDWKVAKAWFGDALNHDPDNAGLKRLVELADYTEKRIQQGNTGKSTNPSSPRTPMQLPKDSDIQYLFPSWHPAKATSAGTQMQMPKDSDINFLFPGLPAIQAREMNDYIFDQALKMAENDPVLIRLSNRPDATR